MNVEGTGLPVCHGVQLAVDIMRCSGERPGAAHVDGIVCTNLKCSELLTGSPCRLIVVALKTGKPMESRNSLRVSLGLACGTPQPKRPPCAARQDGAPPPQPRDLHSVLPQDFGGNGPSHRTTDPQSQQPRPPPKTPASEHAAR